MKVRLHNGLICNSDNHFYCNDNSFMFDGVDYEKDDHNGRCYRLEESCCLRADCDGKLVKKRISQTEYNFYLQRLKDMIPTIEDLKSEKYILVEYMWDKNDKRKPDFYFGGYHKKYSDMIYIATRETAYVFDNKEKAEKTAQSLNKGGYKFEVEQGP